MTLLVIIITFVMQRYLAWGQNISRVNWLDGYLTRMQSMLQKTALWSNVLGVILAILPIVIGIALLQWMFDGWFFSILKFLLNLAVLWFCLDAYPLKDHLADYFSNLAKEDALNTHAQSKEFIREPAEKVVGGLTGMVRAVTCEIFLRSEEGLFGVLFWFLVFGPLGAATYFLIVSIRNLATKQNSPFVELLLPATKIFGVLDWIPVRLLCLSYALVGYFVAGFNYFRKNFFLGIQQTSEFAINAGFAALGMEHIDVVHADAEENRAALLLIDRTIFLWIVVVAIFTLGGWIK